MKVREIMSEKVVTIGEDEPVSAAARLLRRNNIGSLPVCDGKGRLRGMITDRDIVTRCIASDADPKETKVYEIMTRGITTASPFDTLEEAAVRMSKEQVRRLPVTDDGKVVGMLALCDMARNHACDMEAAGALSEISSNFRKL